MLVYIPLLSHIQAADLDLQAGIGDVIILLFLLSLSFLPAVSNGTSNSELKSLNVFPAVEKQRYLLSKICGLLLYRRGEPGIQLDLRRTRHEHALS